ncbi:Hydroxymethylpyrimidine transport system permease protein [Neorhizobium galegae bv. orientalis]|uniref:Hydroxymethylpyrimidine transport system permease protein n=2 Tax=Neorhizobium galegae TaxID=399 RepID=A0A068SRD2_NEOGA|nr:MULTISPECIES: ABC transporter permease [Rhizobium/Agrobacterium group]EUB96811.1 ABC-type transporter, integral membrane subunit [Rhizobium sp. CF080]MCQ1571411.1 ABC transporter permease [Neorhizobium galegae]CDN48852.1 Hydroxymethylpyrimidine transport system permease protein [Neorhizobium galegae bv. orientalis str. HAMBI 540]CDZ55212.1 Hydroxymethylpyrimidine transport system permease protein [Neorhizobium galegae bv. orientalis]
MSEVISASVHRKVKSPSRFRFPAPDIVTLASVVVLVAFLSAWEWVLIPLLNISPALLPKPSAIAIALWSGLFVGDLGADILITLQEVFLGYVLGSAIGFALAIPVAGSRVAERILYPYIVALQAIPKVAIAPLFVIWFGFGMTSKVVIVALITFFPVFVNAVIGLRATPAEQDELFDVYNASAWRRFRYLRLPNSAPYIFGGLNVGVTLSVIGAIVAEFVGAQEGIGSAIIRAGFALDTAGVFAAIAVLTFIAATASAAIQAIGRKLVFWMENPKG